MVTVPLTVMFACPFPRFSRCERRWETTCRCLWWDGLQPEEDAQPARQPWWQPLSSRGSLWEAVRTLLPDSAQHVGVRHTAGAVLPALRHTACCRDRSRTGSCRYAIRGKGFKQKGFKLLPFCQTGSLTGQRSKRFAGYYTASNVIANIGYTGLAISSNVV